eukprot:6203685-Pleurochrysis_carterae.AAC.10
MQSGCGMYGHVGDFGLPASRPCRPVTKHMVHAQQQQPLRCTRRGGIEHVPACDEATPRVRDAREQCSAHEEVGAALKQRCAHACRAHC